MQSGWEQGLYLPSSTRIQRFGELLTPPAAGDTREIAWAFLSARRDELRVNVSDESSYRISDQYTDEASGTTHIYLRQTQNGLEIVNADVSINVSAQGQVINAASSFVLISPGSVNPAEPAISAAQALSALSNGLGNALQPMA